MKLMKNHNAKLLIWFSRKCFKIFGKNLNIILGETFLYIMLSIIIIITDIEIIV